MSGPNSVSTDGEIFGTAVVHEIAGPEDFKHLIRLAEASFTCVRLATSSAHVLVA